MNSKRIDLILLVVLILLAVGWLFKTPERELENPVTVVTEQEEVAQEESTHSPPNKPTSTAPSLDFSKHGETEITQHISKSTGSINGLAISIYNLQTPLLPKARLLDFREFNNRLWFAGDAGLYSFDLASERWFAKTREQGLPRDTAYGIEKTQNGLFLSLLDWTKKGHLGNNLRVEYNGEAFVKTQLTKIRAKTGGRSIPNAAPLKGQVSDYHEANNIDWYCVRGKHAGQGKGFEDGGVIKFDRNTSERAVFRKTDGLLKNYCTSITMTSDQSVWISHWDEEVGLSYLSAGSDRWQVKTNSANGIPLGGPSVYAIGDFLFIAQQRALVIYDPISDMAIDISEHSGLPGFIVSDVQSTADGRIWATSYRYARGGKGQAAAGLISFELNDVKQLF